MKKTKKLTIDDLPLDVVAIQWVDGVLKLNIPMWNTDMKRELALRPSVLIVRELPDNHPDRTIGTVEFVWDGGTDNPYRPVTGAGAIVSFPPVGVEFPVVVKRGFSAEIIWQGVGRSTVVNY